MPTHSRLIAGLAVALTSVATPTIAGAHSTQRTHGLDHQPASTTASIAQAAPAPTDWCPNTDPAANQVENGLYRYHAIYAYPADRPNRLGTVGPQLQQGAFGASALIER